MRALTIFAPALPAEQARAPSRFLAGAEGLLLALVFFYRLAHAEGEEAEAALAMAMFFFAALALACRATRLRRTEARPKLAIEIAAMIAFVAWALLYTGGADSPLHDLYLLPVLASALLLPPRATAAATALVALSFLWLGYPRSGSGETLSMQFASAFLAQVLPVALAAYFVAALSCTPARGGQRARAGEPDEAREPGDGG
jgi:hypothetical protein